MKRCGILLLSSCIVAILLAHLLGGLPHSVPSDEPASNDTARSPAIDADSRSISALGRLEPAKGILNIGATPGDRGIRFGEGIEVGKRIQEDDEIAELDSYSLRTLEVELADNQVTEARNRLIAEEKLAAAKVDAAELSRQQVESHNSQGIATQRQKVGLLSKNLALAVLTEQQFEALHEKNEKLVADTELERYRLLAEQARAELNAGKALLEELEQTGPLAAKAAEAELVAAKAGADQIRASIAVESGETQARLARERQKLSRILAPCCGTILKISTPLYQPIGHEPILLMADLDEMVAVAEVFETDIGHIQLGQTALIQSRAFPAPYNQEGNGLHGRAIEISRVVCSSSIEDRNPYAPKDCHIVEVRLALEDPKEIEIASRFINLQVTVVFPSRDEL